MVTVDLNSINTNQYRSSGIEIVVGKIIIILDSITIIRQT